MKRSTANNDIVYKRDNGRCQLCGIDTKIEAMLLIDFQATWWNCKEAARKLSGKYSLEKPTTEMHETAGKWAQRLDFDYQKYPHLFTWEPKGIGPQRIYPKQMGFPRLLRQHTHEIDHIIPFSQGGSNEPDNLRLLCIPCHLQQTKKLTNKRNYLNRKIVAREKKLKRANEKENYKRWKTRHSM